MRKNNVTIAIVFFISSIAIASCSHKGMSGLGDNDSTTVKKTLVGDDNINKVARFYAGMSKEGVEMSEEDSKAWGEYSQEIKRMLNAGAKARVQVDSLASVDFKDFRNKVDLVFYPFSGADFLYPITIFPDADTYILCGLEKTGSQIGTDIKTNYAQCDSYRKALKSFMKHSYFITLMMKDDLDNENIDGVCPVLTMLMATADYEIISIKNKKIDENGNLIAADRSGNVMEYKFFKKGSKHEQTLYYFSTNVRNTDFDPNFKKYLDITLSKHTMGTYLKAASYMMHWTTFSDIRNYILDNSLAVIQDDSGIAYKHFDDRFDITLYGIYKHPLPSFDKRTYQPDLMKAYTENADKVKTLPFYIGYNEPSNWLCARRIGCK
ncbi:MAG: hypothetical protein IJR20_04040 [Muribaculaceae bacterium]|nr:hypothetical protein [Muribaculaceae bacterium]